MNEITIATLKSSPPEMVEAERSKNENVETPFSDYVRRSLEDVNKKMLDADRAIQQFTLGKNKDIHGTMIAMEKASISFELVMQIRNKLISAYDEIKRMNI